MPGTGNRREGSLPVGAAEVDVMVCRRSASRRQSSTTAELGGLTVQHLDKDFDLIAACTGQPVERLNL